MNKLLEVDIKKKAFQNNLVLSEMSLDLEKNKFTTILGPSGCGKSTLLKAIVGLDNEYDGMIRLNGTDVSEPVKECSMVFQEPRLLPWASVEENVMFPLEKSNGENLSELLTILTLENFSQNLPKELSGGMAQRVSLARALINLPEIILLDEPFSALDIITRHKLQDKLIETLEKRKTTALMVTHDIEEAVYLSDTIHVMKQRPSAIVKTYRIALPKPRNRTSPEFTKKVSEIYKDLRDRLKIL